MGKQKHGAARRPPLSRGGVVAAAIRLADEKGLGGLSMRALAASLGVEAMSLYHHVRNRDDILDGIVDELHSQFYTPVPGQPWRAEITRRTASAREVILAHPWSPPLLSSRRHPGQPTLRHIEAVMACFRSAGFSWELTAHAFAAVDSLLYGFVIQELTLPFAPGSEPEMGAELQEEGALADMPTMVEFVGEFAMPSGYSFSDEFEWGLDLVLDGLERAAEKEGA